MKKLLKPRIILVLIILLAAVLRFYSLGDIPGSLNWDEVSWGYNSYSVLETGKDEHGKFMPLSFEAFGDFKQPVYVYLSTIPIKLFGLTPFSVRFISAIAGTLSVLTIYLLVTELFFTDKNRKQIGLIAALLMAISPWSIVFSRVAYEANVALFFVLFGVYLFILSIRLQNSKILFLSIIPLTVSSFTYHSLKIFTPIFTFILAIYAYRYSNFKKSIIMLFLILYALSNIIWVLDMRSTSRGRSVLIFSQQTVILKDSLQQMDYDIKNNDNLFRQFHNRRIVFGLKLFENYLSHFDVTYLLVKGDNPRHHAPGVGLIYVVNLFFILVGGYFVFQRHRKSAYLIFTWILIAPVASSLAIEAPNASRNLIMLPGLLILASYGWFMSYKNVFKDKFRILKIILPLLLFANFIYFIHQYYVHVNTSTLDYWQDGYEEAVKFASELDKDNKVFLSDSIEQGYMFYLFYNKVDPAEYISKGGSTRINKSCFSIDNVYFGKCANLLDKGDYLISKNRDAGDIDMKEIGNSGIFVYKIIEKKLNE